MSKRLRTFQIPKDIKIELLVQNLRRFLLSGVCLLEELHREKSGTNVSSPGDKDRVNNGSEQVQLTASQMSSEAEPRSFSGKLSVGLATNSCL